MDNSFDQESIETKQKASFLGGLYHIGHKFNNWLITTLWLTEEEKNEAGVFLGYDGEDK